MARPTKPKDLKPKADADISPTAIQGGGGKPGIDLKFIVTLLLVVVLSIVGTAGSSYVVGTYVLLPAIQDALAHGGAPAEGEGEHGAEAPVSEVGMNLELDEFMVNLKPDPAMGGNQYLRAKVALSVQVPAQENCYELNHHALLPNDVDGGTVMGAAAPVDRETLASGGSAPDPAAACEAAFKNNMAKFVPTIRDIINASLMKRTATTLATLEGQEQLKDEIKTELTNIMAPKYAVLRVNFEDFIIQR